MKTIEEQREYLRNWRAKKRLEKARLKAEETEPVVLTPPQEPVDNITPVVDNITPVVDNSSESESESDSEGTSAGDGDWEDMVEEISAPKEQAGSFSKIIMALVLSIAMPVIGLVVSRLGGTNECAELKKKDLKQSEQPAQLPPTSLAPSCDNIDGLGLKFT